jgi:hypothetical protein
VGSKARSEGYRIAYLCLVNILIYLASYQIFLLKKTGAIFLLLVMLLCGSGFYISWYISVQCIYNSQRNLISSQAYKKQNVVEFAFSVCKTKNNPDIVFDDDEMEYRQEMYDIINIRRSGDSIYLNCIADRNEDNLKQIIASQMFSSTNDISKQLPISHFRLDNYINLKSNCAGTVIFAIRNYYISFTSGILPVYYVSTPSPPPRMVA